VGLLSKEGRSDRHRTTARTRFFLKRRISLQLLVRYQEYVYPEEAGLELCERKKIDKNLIRWGPAWGERGRRRVLKRPKFPSIHHLLLLPPSSLLSSIPSSLYSLTMIASLFTALVAAAAVSAQSSIVGESPG